MFGGDVFKGLPCINNSSFLDIVKAVIDHGQSVSEFSLSHQRVIGIRAEYNGRRLAITGYKERTTGFLNLPDILSQMCSVIAYWLDIF